MQFYLNGFRSGDPGRSDAIKDALPEEVDVLIVGCGPTGLTLAAQLAAFPSIRTRIIEQKSGPLQLGQADGVACRTMEMFQAFGFAERVLREAYWVNETSFWTPDQNEPGRISRARVVQDVEDGLSEFPHVILNQARIHEFYLDVMHHAATPLEPAYARRLVSLKLDSASLGEPSAFPLTARIERVDGGLAGAPEIVRARYVVGCDGARSAVRGFIGRTLKGDAANQAWGVMDVLAVTDFPDIRRKAAIHSAAEGSMLIIPREGGYLVRMYVELDKLAENQRVANLDVTPEHLIAAAGRILHPYSLDVKEVAWWSVYEIGHRLCDGFDDRLSEADQGRIPRVFIAGDACHTHSPKAGQGMNVSMQDAFNLGWKLAAVLTGRAAPRLLSTYSDERKAIAKDLFDFDHKWARMFSARPKGAPGAAEDAVDPAEFQEYFIRHGRYTAGVATCYKPSLLTGPSTNQNLAKGFVIGMRFHSAPVIRLADAMPMHLGHTVRADGRWRLFAFADAARPSDPASRLRGLCAFLEDSPSSPLKRFTTAGADIDGVIELIAVFQQAHCRLLVSELPGLLLPRKGRYGLIDYEKAYCPDHKKGPDIFDLRGIDRANGALVIVRPDQYVAHVLPIDDYEELQRFFDAFMIDAPSPAAVRVAAYAAARATAAADAFDGEKEERAGHACDAYGAGLLMRNPGRLHITWENENTLRVEADAGQQTRLLRFGQSPPGTVEASRQGRSTAKWQIHQIVAPYGPPIRTPGAKNQGYLQVSTDSLLPGLLRKNGAPYGSMASMNEYWEVYTMWRQHGHRIRCEDAYVQDWAVSAHGPQPITPSRRD